ncbi:MAG TPA: phosphomannomutase/phosphoglucomutase, partial [Vicinamibacteria bacterium]|nr:phosphomannomutase/phosphoglucomutase [Vicinamibacteria bacterium]
MEHPMIDPSIFKAYDLRGLYPGQINGDVARQVGAAFVDYLNAARIAVGRDVRLSSPEIATGFIRGAASRGCEVVDIGVVGTDMLYYAVARHDYDGGAIITASHNPKEWNGMKMVRRGAYALSGDAGIKEIKEWVLAGRYAAEPEESGPTLSMRNVIDSYAEHCLSFIDRDRIPRLKAVLDTANGMGAVGAAAIFPRLPLELVTMYFELDGTFPNHPADPLLE